MAADPFDIGPYPRLEQRSDGAEVLVLSPDLAVPLEPGTVQRVHDDADWNGWPLEVAITRLMKALESVWIDALAAASGRTREEEIDFQCAAFLHAQMH